MSEPSMHDGSRQVSKPLSAIVASSTAIVSLLAAILLRGWLNRPEQVPGTDILAGFPIELAGRWLGTNLDVSQREREILQATGIVMRSYALVRPPEDLEKVRAGQLQASQPVSLYVAYYHSQRTGATYHSPQNCMPGAGWQITELNAVRLPASVGEHEPINEVVLQKGLEKQLVMYWYQDRGRIVADEYWAKAYMIWDATTSNRSDGSLVRASVTATGDLVAARAHLQQFVADVWPILNTTLPGKVW